MCGATWRELRVGELVVVRDGEGVPADLVLLAVGRPEGVAFVRTVRSFPCCCTVHQLVGDACGCVSLHIIAACGALVACDGILVAASLLEPCPSVIDEYSTYAGHVSKELDVAIWNGARQVLVWVAKRHSMCAPGAVPCYECMQAYIQVGWP